MKVFLEMYFLKYIFFISFALCNVSYGSLSFKLVAGKISKEVDVSPVSCRGLPGVVKFRHPSEKFTEILIEGNELKDIKYINLVVQKRKFYFKLGYQRIDLERSTLLNVNGASSYSVSFDRFKDIIKNLRKDEFIVIKLLFNDKYPNFILTEKCYFFNNELVLKPSKDRKYKIVKKNKSLMIKFPEYFEPFQMISFVYNYGRIDKNGNCKLQSSENLKKDQNTAGGFIEILDGVFYFNLSKLFKNKLNIQDKDEYKGYLEFFDQNGYVQKMEFESKTFDKCK